jgi:hypothetical protein
MYYHYRVKQINKKPVAAGCFIIILKWSGTSSSLWFKSTFFFFLVLFPPFENAGFWFAFVHKILELLVVVLTRRVSERQQNGHILVSSAYLSMSVLHHRYPHIWAYRLISSLSTVGFIFKVPCFDCGSNNSRSRGRFTKNSKPTPPAGIFCVA